MNRIINEIDQIGLEINKSISLVSQLNIDKNLKRQLLNDLESSYSNVYQMGEIKKIE